MKKYSIVAIISIFLIGLFVYINSADKLTLFFFGVKITLFTALWVVIFLSFFFILSFIAMAIIKYGGYRFSKNIKKDLKNLQTALDDKLLYKKRKVQKINELKLFDALIDRIEGTSITPKESEDIPLLEMLEKIEAGESVDLHKYKLPIDNPWVVKNKKNEITGDRTKAKEIYKTTSNEELKAIAFEVLKEDLSLEEVLEFNLPLTKERLLENVEADNIAKLIELSDLKESDYIDIAQAMYESHKSEPDLLLDMFNKRVYAYVYLLIEFEVIDKAKEVTKENELAYFDYYLTLREEGNKIEIKDFLNARFF